MAVLVLVLDAGFTSLLLYWGVPESATRDTTYAFMLYQFGVVAGKVSIAVPFLTCYVLWVYARYFGVHSATITLYLQFGTPYLVVVSYIELVFSYELSLRVTSFRCDPSVFRHDLRAYAAYIWRGMVFGGVMRQLCGLMFPLPVIAYIIIARKTFTDPGVQTIYEVSCTLAKLICTDLVVLVANFLFQTCNCRIILGANAHRNYTVAGRTGRKGHGFDLHA